MNVEYRTLDHVNTQGQGRDLCAYLLPVSTCQLQLHSFQVLCMLSVVSPWNATTVHAVCSLSCASVRCDLSSLCSSLTQITQCMIYNILRSVFRFLPPPRFLEGVVFASGYRFTLSPPLTKKMSLFYPEPGAFFA